MRESLITVKKFKPAINDSWQYVKLQTIRWNLHNGFSNLLGKLGRSGRLSHCSVELRRISDPTM